MSYFSRTSILRHKASYLKLQIRNDGYAVVSDMLKLDIKTRPGIPLSAYTVDDVLKVSIPYELSYEIDVFNHRNHQAKLFGYFCRQLSEIANNGFHY